MADLTIADVRAKFPQYDDLSDQQLADAVHQKFYADVPRPDFYARIGLAVAPSAANPTAAPEDTAGFSSDLLAAMGGSTPAPPRTPAPAQIDAPAARPMQPGSLIEAMTGHDAAPVIDRTRPPSPPVRPREGGLEFGMMGGASPETEAWARREIARQEAERIDLVRPKDSPGIAPALQRQATTAAPDPFAGEGMGDMAARRGQQFARGATTVIASVPEALELLGRDIVRTRLPTFNQAGAALSAERETLLGIIEAEGAESQRGRAAALRLQAVDGELIRAARLVQEDAARLEIPLEDTKGFKAGKALRAASEETFGTPDPRDTGFWAKLAEGGGSVAGFAGASLLGAPLGPGGVLLSGGLTGAATNSSQLYQEAIQAGADEETALRAARIGGLVGSSEVLPIGRALKLLPKGMRNKVGGFFFKRLTHIAESAGEEAAQEFAMQVANNWVAKGLYDPERGWFDGAGESALIGAILGGGMGAIGSARGEGKADQLPMRTPDEPRERQPQQPPAPLTDPLLAAMGAPAPEAPAPAQPAPAQPQAPAPEAAPVQPAATTKAPEAAPAAPEAQPQADAGRYEIMDEVETVDGETRPTGRKVRIDMETGQASVVDANEAAAGSDAAGAPGGADAGQQGQESQPQGREAKGVTSPAPAAGGARPAPQRKFLSHEETLAIETDPDTFQYKGGSDTEGVTSALKGVSRFDPNRAGQVVIFETKDGRRIVADGHQRTGLARRMADAGQEDVGGMAAVIYREADGYTPEEVMALAALKNIGEGSGSAVDAARVLRSRSETIEDLGLPPNSALVRDAEGLRRLSVDAFGMVVNGAASEQHGAIVGRAVPNQEVQANILGLLSRLKPANAFQAETIARQAAAETTTETQDSLFGPEEIATSLYLERAKVLDGAVKAIRDDIRTLTDRADAITGAGNVLAKDENTRRLDADAKLRDYLTSQANMKGPISDALGQAARAVKDGTPVAAATRRFVEDVRRALEGDGTGGQASSGGRGEPEGQPRQEPVSPPEGDLLAAMGATPQTQTPAAKPEPDLLAAMGAAPAKNPEPDAKAKAEAQVKAKQSKMGTTTPQGDAGPLFNAQADIEDAKPALATTAAVRRAALIDEHTKGPETPPEEFADLFDQPEGQKLIAKMEGKTPKERRAIADDWVLKTGRKAGSEHLVVFDAQGVPVIIARGGRASIWVPEWAYFAGDAGDLGYATHNHPGDGGLSAQDLVSMMAMQIEIKAMGHADVVHGAKPGPVKPRNGLPPHSERTLTFSEAIRYGADRVHAGLQDRINGLTGDAFTQRAALYKRAHYAILNVILHRMGIIEYTGDADRVIAEAGVQVDDFIETVEAVVLDGFGRAGFLVSEIRDHLRAGKPEGDGADTGGRGRAEAAEPADGDGDRGGRVRQDGKPEVKDDFGAALDDLFGAKPEKPARSKSDIAKDLGDIFGEDGDLFNMPEQPKSGLTARERAEIEARQRQSKIRRANQTRVEDDLQSLFGHDRQGNLFGEGDIDEAKYARAAPVFKEALADIDVANTPRKDVFIAMIRPLIAAGLNRQAIENMRPYFERFLNDVDRGIISLAKGTEDAQRTDGNLERDRGDAAAQDGLGKADVPAAGRPDGKGAGTGRGAPDQGDGRQPGGERLPSGDAAPVGTEGNPPVQGSRGAGKQPADGGNRAAGRNPREPGISPDESATEATVRHAQDGPELKGRAAAQRAADERARRGIKLGDEEDVRATLPLLKPEQQDDVVKIERRFAKPDGHGMMLTNGTGTGKTYSGGGVIKRFAQAGKTNILVIAPSQGILDHWAEALHDLGLKASKLDDTKTAGEGIVLTTYANVGKNRALASREWDLIVSDEAHKLSQNAQGDATSALDTLRAISHRPSDLWRKSEMMRAAEWDRLRAMKDGEAKTALAHRLYEQRKQDVERLSQRPRAKVLFLSATPFAYVKNTDYAEGYLFDYPKDGHVGNSRQGGQALFMVENFGYRIRYHKLTRPDANVDTGVFEREFHEKLKREGVLSGRHLDVEPDYERRFVQTEDAQGTLIDDILKFIREQAYGQGPDKDAYAALLTSVGKSFNYLKRMQLLEAIKAKIAQQDIDKHLAMGRKVVLFHDFNRGGGFNPFAPHDEAALEGYAKLLAARPEVADLNFRGYLPPVQELKQRYGKRAVIYNGTIPNKERDKAKTAFNTDGSGTDIMIVQSAAGEAGISLHDISGGHQRVLINLGMPTRPTTALQEEGRIRREGSVSDALFHYYTIGTTWERQAFARKIAERSGTVENLALGNEARTIRDAFIDAYEEASPWAPGEGDGKGGKERDRAVAKASPYEIAKTHYFGRMKTAGRRDQRQGIDFYPTPEPLAFKMVEWAQIRPYERVLEPSAGDGSIARYFPDHSDRTIVEPSVELLSKAELRAIGARAVNSTFEAYHVVNKHHAIIMNPPFGSGGKTAIEHLAKAATHLRPGGRIVALIPTGPAADKRFDAWWDSDESEGLWRSAEVALPAVTFEKAGTAVAARILIIDKVDPVASDLLGSTSRINMTGAQSIGQFFDRLEGIAAPARPKAAREAVEELLDEQEEANPALAAPERPAQPLPDQGFSLAQTTHGKTGEALFVATATARVSDEAFKATVAVAKRHGGWYSSFRGKGAVPGYQFKSEAQRQAFLDDMGKPTTGLQEEAAGFARPVFFSPLLRAVEGAKQARAPAKDWKAIIAKLPGVKKAEMEWTGVLDWLDTADGQVERADIVAFLRANQIEIIEERQTEEGEDFDPDEQAAEEALGHDLIEEPDFEISDGEPLYPDDWDDEAEFYLDEARETLAEEAMEDWDEEEMGEFDPASIADDEVMDLARQIAEERYEPHEYSVTLYDRNGDASYDGYWNADDRSYYFPALSDENIDHSDALNLATAPIMEARQKQVEEKLKELLAEHKASQERQRAEDGFAVVGSARWRTYTQGGGENYQEVLLRIPLLHKIGKNRTVPVQDVAELKRIESEMDRLIKEKGTRVKYTEEYMALQRQSTALTDGVMGKIPFVQSSHFSRTNVVVHARIKDRQDKAGNRVLFIEEIQSDLASKWRENTESVEVTLRRRALEEAFENLAAADREDWNILENAVSEHARAAGANTWKASVNEFLGNSTPSEPDYFHSDKTRAAVASFNADPKVQRAVERMKRRGGERTQLRGELTALGTEKRIDPMVPQSPFSDPEQYTVMVKRLLREAAARGYGKIAWTPGYMQAERWNNAAQSVVSRIEWEPSTSGTAGASRDVLFLMAGGGREFSATVDAEGKILATDAEPFQGKTLQAIIGPSLAKQVLGEEKGNVGGQKIVLPDSGYAIAYDGHIRRAVDKLTRVHGVKAEPDTSIYDLITDRLGARSTYLEGLTTEEIIDRIANVEPARTERLRNLLREDPTNEPYIRSIATEPISDAAFVRLFRDRMEDGPQVWSVEINDALRAAATEPMPLFQRQALRRTRPVSRETIRRMMPRLRAELDRLDLKRVHLFEVDPARYPMGGQDDWQGLVQHGENGDLEIIIGASLDPMKTIHHEVIHILRGMNLFTPEEWRALELSAARKWVKEFDIVARYPNLTPSEQIEEAIAEAFAEAVATKKAPAGSAVIRAFNKIARLLKAIANVFRGAGFNTVEDVFGRVIAGELSRRNAANTGALAMQRGSKAQAARVPNRQARAHMATAMGGNAAHIPDRRVWEELTRTGAPIWQRLRQGAGAAHDAVDKARIKMQDRFLPVLRAQEAVVRTTGATLSADQNAYLKETTFSGKVGRHLFEIDEEYTKPIIDIIAKTKGALTSEAVGEWLYARHAIERNARIAAINPRMPDGGSGMTDAEAQQILADAAAGPFAADLDRIGTLIDGLRERTLKLREDAGLITHREANLWRHQYRHYVPLKGFSETDHSEAVLDIAGVGRRFNTRGAESRRALGRRSEAFNPLQAAITQAQEVSIRAEKNRVGQALYNLAKDFPSKALWSVKKPKMKQVYNRTTGLVESRLEDPVSLLMDPNEMAVKISGKEVRIVFHDPRLAQAAGSVGADQIGWFVGFMSMASRFFSSINTMLDPEFVVRNAARDMTAAQLNIRNFGEADRNAIAKAMIRNWPKAFVGAFRGQGYKADSTWTRYYREFEKAGAKVSFWKLEQPEAGKSDLDKRIRLAGGSRLGPVSRFVRLSTRDNPVLGFIERTNLAVDNAVRLAAFVAARQRGWSAQDAAALSKNLTVNFNRRGEWGATINALYPFANAATQGSQVLLRAITHKRMAKYTIGLIALGVILDAVNAGLSGEDDDGELAYDKIPDFKNQTNMVVMLGPDSDNGATLWMPYGWNLFPYIGQQIGKVRRGVKGMDEALGDVATAFFTAFSPIQGGSLQSVITPTMLDPINEMAMNEDWLGRPIRPENAYSDYGPDAYKFFGGASEASKLLADTMNRATGGTIGESGAVDISPEYIDHFFGFITGGAGRFVGRVSDLVAKAAAGNFEEIEQRDVPVARSLYYETGDWLDRDRYYRFRDEVREANAAAKAYQEAGDRVPDHVKRLAALYPTMLQAERAIKAMKKAGSQDQGKVFIAFNRRFLSVMGKQGE
jgi:hypothetical protein